MRRAITKKSIDFFGSLTKSALFPLFFNFHPPDRHGQPTGVGAIALYPPTDVATSPRLTSASVVNDALDGGAGPPRHRLVTFQTIALLQTIAERHEGQGEVSRKIPFCQVPQQKMNIAKRAEKRWAPIARAKSTDDALNYADNEENNARPTQIPLPLRPPI